MEEPQTLTAEVETVPEVTIVSPKEIKKLISDNDFNPEDIEQGLTDNQVNDFRRVQSSALQISKQKHHNEIMANWALGFHIDQMMTILETCKEESNITDRAAIHCSKVFNLLEKQVTDFRRFAQRFPDQEDVERLIAKGPSWTIIRYLLRYETEVQLQEAMEWMVPEDRFISSGDLKRIEERKAAEKETGSNKSLKDISEEVIQEKKEKQAAKTSGEKTTPSGSKLENASFAKLLKQAERLGGDVVEVTTLLTMRIKRLDEIEDEKTHEKLVNTLKDKVQPELDAAMQNIEAFLDMVKEI